MLMPSEDEEEGRWSSDHIDYTHHWLKEVPRDRPDYSDTSCFDYFKHLLPQVPFKVVELGCGMGSWCTAWKSMGGEYLGIDQNKAAIDLAQSQPNHKGTVFWLRKAQDFNFIPEFWDVIFSHAFLQHTNLETKKKLFPNVFQGLKKGGLFIIEDKFDEKDLRSPEEVTYYDREGWVKLLSGYGFEFVLASERGNGMVFRKRITSKKSE